MNRPKFSTILRQAKEQCIKEFDTFDMHVNGDNIVKFFASGMEYRMSRTHNEAERTFLSCSDQNAFLMGYLQGKGADTEMIELLEDICMKDTDSHSYWTDVFMRGLFYEASILESDKSQPPLD